nr:hypothetical protein CFP56_23174 [Quercus suber]
MVADITSVKFRIIGPRNLRIQDQYCGRRYYLSQDQIHWLQEPMYPRSSRLVADTPFAKIKLVGRRHSFRQDQACWSQTLILPRSSLLVADTPFVKI